VADGPTEKQPPISEKQLTRWRLVEDFRQRLALEAKNFKTHRTWHDPARLLQLSDYLSLLLLGLLNPTVKTMRALCSASHLSRVQEEICSRPVSLGSFSEAQAAVDPALLQNIFQDLVQGQPEGQHFGDPRLNKYQKVLLAVDSTLWHVLPRMSWAIWRGADKAARLHVKFCILQQHVSEAEFTHANICERKQWKKGAKPGQFYVGDRNFGEDYQLLRWMQRRGCGFVVRLRQVSQWVQEQALELSEADRAAGVCESAWVRLGKGGDGARVRLVRIKSQGEELLLVTDRGPEELSAELVGLIYRYRWQIELFFRWLKCIFGCRHWLMHSQQGAATQIYLALIAAQLLVLYGAPKPSKRQMELLQMYLMGWATLEELCSGLRLQSSGTQKS
jgi:hypothetical protein